MTGFRKDVDNSLLFFFLILVIIFCNCGFFDSESELLFFFLILVILFGGCFQKDFFGIRSVAE